MKNKINRFAFLSKFAAKISLVLMLLLPQLFIAQQKAPNVIVIMTDDVGWGDLGCYGGGVMRGAPTPNLDRMATEGMRFVNYYGQASCTAGRASFITGRIPIRSALSSVLVPGDPNGLSAETPTISEMFKKAGYTTMFTGKWHLGDKPANYPTSHGYDEMYNMLPYYAGVYAYDNKELHPNFPSDDPEFMKVWNTINLSVFEGKAGQTAKAVKQKFTFDDLATADDDIRATTVDYIKKHSGDKNPFFITVCFEKVHNPNNPSPRWKGKSPGHGNYLDALMEVDDNSGQIIQAIRDAKIDQNTLIIWTTDNGAWLDAWPDAGYTPFRGTKGSVYEGGFRVPAIAWWPGHIKAGSLNTDMFSHMDWWPTIASIIGAPVPTHIWKDNNGASIVFDGIDLSASLLSTGPGKRTDFFYFASQFLGAVRVKNFKFALTAKDTWLGTDKTLRVAATYDLLWDPAEQYDMTFNGAAPNGGNQTSPGRYSGTDNGWAGMYFASHVIPFIEDMKKYPNKNYIPFGEGLREMIPEEFK